MDLTLYDPDSSHIILGDIIEKHLTKEEQLIAEALGKLFYDRAGKEWESRGESYEEWDIVINQWEKAGRKYVDFYKFMGYQMVAKCKGTEQRMNDIAGRPTHNYRELLVIMFGGEVREIFKNPRQHLFA